MEKKMTRKNLPKEKTLEELKVLKQPVVELEALEAANQTDEKSNQFEKQKYKAVFESANDAILLIDKKGVIIDVNKRLKDFSGYAKKELIGKNIASLVQIMTKKSLALTQSNFLKRLVGANVPPYEVEMIIKNKESVTIEISAQPLMGNDKIVGYLVILRDVTGHKQAAEVQATIEQNLRNSLDNLPLGFRINDIDDNTLYSNQAFRNIFGYENIDEVNTNPPLKHYTPESYADYFRRKEQYLRGESVSNAHEVDIVRKDGVIRHLQLSTVELVWNGKKQFQTLFNDVTDHKMEEEALKTSEENFRNSMDSSLMGIRIGDANYTVYANQALLDIFGYKNIDEIRANPPQAYYTPESYASWVLRHEKIIRGEPVPDNLDIDIIRKDGAIRHLQVFRKKVLWDGKHRYQSIYHDITARKTAEEALRASEEKYRLIVENSNDIIFTLNTAGEFMYLSPSVKKILGYNQDDLLGVPFRSLVHPDDLHVIENAVRLGDTAANQTTEGNQYRFRHASGEWRWHISRGTRMPDTGGKSFHFVGIANDITAWKKAEEALKASEQNFRNSLDSSSMGIHIVDTDMHLQYVNQAFLDMFGYDNINELRASPPEEHYTPESYAAYLRRKEQYSRGEPASDPHEVDIIRKDGAIRHLQISSREILWNGKQHRQFLHNDITERTEIEEALKISEQTFRNSLDRSPAGIHIMADAGYTLYANQALLDIFGYKNIDELRASPTLEHYTPESYANYFKGKERYERGEIGPDHMAIDIVRKDGSIRHLDALFLRVFWDGKQQYETVYTDTTERIEIEEALKISEQNFRNSLDSSPIGARIVDQYEQTLYANQALLDIFGYANLGEMLLSPPKEHFTAKSAESALLHKKQRLNDKNFLEKVEVDIIRKDNTTRHLQIFPKDILWNGKKELQLYYNDITELKQAQEALKSSEQNFRTSIDSSSLGIRISDKDSYTLYSNQALLDIFGYENIDEVKAKPPKEYYSPESYADYLKMMGKYERGEIIPDHMDIDIVRKDGSIRHLQALFLRVLWDGEQQYQAIYTDVTEHKQVEEKLRQASQEWRTTFDSITDLITIHDKDNRIISVNKAVADMLKTTQQELIGKYCHQVMHGTKEPPAYCPHLLTSKTGKSTTIEWFNPDTEVYLYESSSPMFNEKGEVTGSIIVARDVTQQKRMEEQLIMTDRLASIGELSSGIAHELNNPLTSVIGFSQLLMEGDAPANIKEDLATIYSEAQRAAVIVKNLLTFARKHAPIKQLSQINTVVEDVLRLRAYEQKVNNIEIERHLAINLPEIMMDHFQMQQVFLNIVVNAEFAMLEAHHEGKMVITTEKIDNIIKISFADDGPGISEENLKRIFDPFFTTKEVGKGTGLGLSICHGIVSEHGGKIYAKSENGRGTSFIVELPLNGQ